uniref:Adhesion G protein-coupled receptor B1 isoform X3 n=1 Tax=Petromyzon marinus TaxID=7757 RepID=A0AAJ7WUK2_PETMA|nr:adhesion G protein-coupled receptor B1 isoform X3 [Petromyzon marinus]
MRPPRMPTLRIMTLFILVNYHSLAGWGQRRDERQCWSSVQKAFYGSFTSRDPSHYHDDRSGCGWIIANPDPAKYGVFVKLSKDALACSSHQLLAYMFDSKPFDNRTSQDVDILREVWDVCDVPSAIVYFQTDARYLQLRFFSEDGSTEAASSNALRGADGPGVSLEFVVLATEAPSAGGCQLVCGWLTGCPCRPTLLDDAALHCGIVQAPCDCSARHLDDPGGGGGETGGGRGAAAPEECGGNYKRASRRSSANVECDPAKDATPGWWATWSEWGACSRSCGGGLRVRRRECDARCPHACEGSAEETDGCGEQDCPNRRSQTKYALRSHGLRSVDFRNRETRPAPYVGSSYSSHSGSELNTEEWSKWSACSVTCGHSIQIRTRSCVTASYGSLCASPLRETKPCNTTVSCPINGLWDEWSPWSLCSSTCGRGYRERVRSCTQPQHGGRRCEGPERLTKNCNIALCPVDGHWSKWTSWSPCSVTCSNGTQQRTRDCMEPSFGGSDCRGSVSEERPCYNADCPSSIEELRKCNGRKCTALHEFCDQDVHIGLTWKQISAGETAINRCPPNASGIITRRCSLDSRGLAYWEPPSYSLCVSHHFNMLLQTMKEHLSKGHRPSASEGMAQVMRNLFDSSHLKHMYSGDLLVSVDILKNVTEAFKTASYNPSSEDVQNYAQIFSNLLSEEHKEKWDDAQQLYPASLDLMKIVENFIHIVGAGIKSVHTSYLITENIVISIRKLFIMEETADITFPVKARRGMVEWARNTEDKVTISKATLSSFTSGMQESAVVGNVLYKTLGSILPPPRNASAINSRVISVTVSPTMKTITPPIEIVFSHLLNVTSNSFCVIWNSTKNGEGSWSERGCRAAISDAAHTRCLCERASAFAILAPLSDEQNTDRLGMSSVSLAVGCIISSLALSFLIVVYLIFWRAIKSDRSVILINFCFSIIASNILIVVGQTQMQNKVACAIIAGLLHFFFLASFCWVLTEAWQSYMAVIGRLRHKIVRKRFLCLGWGLPALVVAISIGFTKAKGYGTASYCWLSLEGGLLYAFVGPAAMVVLVNMVIGILVFNKLVSKEGIPDKRLKHRAGPMTLPQNGLTLKCSKCGVVSASALSTSTASNAMASLWSSCVVLPLLALTWMSAVLAITDRRSPLFQILFAVFDSLQGFVIVIVHCVLRKEVQDALKCRLGDTQDHVNGDSSGSFPNGHVQIMSDFEKDVDMACRSVLHKDINTCRRSAKGPLTRATVREEEILDKKDFQAIPGGPAIPMGSAIPDIQLQGPSGYLSPIGMAPILGTEQPPWSIEGDGGGRPLSGLYEGGDLMTPLQPQQQQPVAAVELSSAEKRALESDYVVLPRSSVTFKDQEVMGMGVGLMGQGTLSRMGLVMGMDQGMALGVGGPDMEQYGMAGLEQPLQMQHQQQQHQYQNVPLESRPMAKHYSLTKVSKEAMMGGTPRSETSSTVSISSLERRKSRYSELDVEKIMRTRKRHQEMFQELNQKFQTYEKGRESPTVDIACQEKQTPSKTSWDCIRRASPTQQAWGKKEAYGEAHQRVELKNIEWEKPGATIPLGGHESDIQTEV